MIHDDPNDTWKVTTIGRGPVNTYLFVITPTIGPATEGPHGEYNTARDSARLQFGHDAVSGDGASFVVRAGTDERLVEERREYHSFLLKCFPNGSLISWLYLRIGPDTALLDDCDAPHDHVQPRRFASPDATADEGAALASYFMSNRTPPTELLLSYLRKREPHPDDERFGRSEKVNYNAEPVYDNRMEIAASIYNRGLHVPAPLNSCYTALGEMIACRDWRERVLTRVGPGERDVVALSEKLSQCEQKLAECDRERILTVLLAMKLAQQRGWLVRAYSEQARYGKSEVLVQIGLGRQPSAYLTWKMAIDMDTFRGYPELLQFLGSFPSGMVTASTAPSEPALLAYLSQATP